jgi:hypothetical protein
MVAVKIPALPVVVDHDNRDIQGIHDVFQGAHAVHGLGIIIQIAYAHHLLKSVDNDYPELRVCFEKGPQVHRGLPLCLQPRSVKHGNTLFPNPFLYSFWGIFQGAIKPHRISGL